MEVIISIKKQRGGYYNIEFENGETIRLPLPLLKAFPLKMGDSIDIEQYFENHSKEALKFAAQRAAFLLTKRDYTEKEMYRKLKDVGYADNIIKQLLKFLIERNFIDDTRYTKNYILRRMKKVSSYKIMQELMRKGVRQTTIKEELERNINHSDTITLAMSAAEKYLKSRMNLEPPKRYKNTIAMLVRKGFGFEIAKEAYEAAESKLES